MIIVSSIPTTEIVRKTTVIMVRTRSCTSDGLNWKGIDGLTKIQNINTVTSCGGVDGYRSSPQFDIDYSVTCL